MRIAHFYGHDGANGVSWSIQDVSRRLAERGHTAHLICRTDSALMAYPDRTPYLFFFGGHIPPLAGLVRRVLIEQRIDVLNAHSQRDAQVALTTARELGIPTCYSCRELSELACGFAPLADRVIAVSVGVGHFLTERYGIRPPVLHVVPNGIDPSLLPTAPKDALRAEQGFARDEVWVGFAGRVVPNKNVEGLLRGFAAVAGAYPALRLAVVGKGRLLGASQRLAAQLGVAARVRFYGWLPRDAAFRVMGALDALALPSLGAEGLSNVLLTAMAQGVPVLATEIPSLAGGPLRDGDTGWLCPADPNGLAAGLARIAAADPAARAAMGAAARAEIDRNHRMERVVDQMEAAYQDALSLR